MANRQTIPIPMSAFGISEKSKDAVLRSDRRGDRLIERDLIRRMKRYGTIVGFFVCRCTSKIEIAKCFFVSNDCCAKRVPSLLSCREPGYPEVLAGTRIDSHDRRAWVRNGAV